jgi:hypothetical protein
MARNPSRASWPRVVCPVQRRQLVQLARVAPDREKPFIDEVTCSINGYRRRMRVADQETPAAVAESMRQLTNLVATYMRNVSIMPDYVICELKPPLPPADWFERANEKLREKEQWLKGHRPQRLTEALIMHALVLQKMAGTYSSYLVSNRKAMRDWLEIPLDASGDRPGKNYFNQVMLPRAADGIENCVVRNFGNGIVIWPPHRAASSCRYDCCQ